MKKSLFLFMIISLFTILMVACNDNESADNVSSAEATSSDSSKSDASNNSGETQSLKGTAIKVATHDQKTASYVFSAALGEILKDEDGISLDVLPYAGGIGNVELVDNGDADFGISFNVAAKWGQDGTVAFDNKHENIRGLAASLGDYNIGIIVTKKFQNKYNITSLQDITDQKIPVKLISNATGSMGEIVTQVTLEAYGLSYDKIKEFGGGVELTSSDVILGAMKDGTADLYIMTMAKAHNVVSELALTTDIEFLPIKEDSAKDYLASLGFIRDASYNPGEYGQEGELDSPAFNVNYIINKNVSDEVAYILAKRISENKEALANAHAVINDFDPSVAGHLNLNGIDLHPGAKKYYEEVGALD